MLPSLPGAPLPAAFCSPLALLPDRQDAFMYAVVSFKAAQFLHVDLRRSHGAICSVQKPGISVYGKESKLRWWLISACQYAICYTIGDNVVQTCFKLVSLGKIIIKAGCFPNDCQPVPYHLVISWIKVQALAQSCSSRCPVTHCHVSHSQPKTHIHRLL